MKLDRIFFGLDISASGLRAQRKRMNAISENIANVETTSTEEGGPYKRKMVQFKTKSTDLFSALVRNADRLLSRTDAEHLPGFEAESNDPGTITTGVDTSEVCDSSDFKLVYDPSHPDADGHGYVKMPNVNIVTEMVDMISASRGYEANVMAINAAKTMAKDTLEI
jgi:flagellar basal-body rod protein FlgC